MLALRIISEQIEVCVCGLDVIAGDLVIECPNARVRDQVAFFLSRPMDWP